MEDSLFQYVKKVAIVDDDPNEREIASMEIESIGLNPISFESPFRTINEALDKIISHSNAIVCDNRLAYKGFASFNGAELLAQLYDKKFPGVLISTYIDPDVDTSIRKYRRKIPAILSREMADAKSVLEGIRICYEEINGKILDFRKPHRTLLKIVSLYLEGKERVADAIIYGWNPKNAVRFPTSIIDEKIRSQVASGKYFFADINIGSNESRELYFNNFELAPELDPNDGLS